MITKNKIPISMQRRIAAQPWCVSPDILEFLSRWCVTGSEPEDRPEPTWAIRTAGYTGFNLEGFNAGTLPDVPSGWHVSLVWGMLGRAWSAAEKYWLDAIEVDDLVADIENAPEKNIVLWFRSPGGVSSGMPETVAAIRELAMRKNIVAFTDDVMASAAYWLASAADKIIATPTAQVGSIGVYTAFYDYSRMIENAGIDLELFKAGRLKAMGIPGKPLTDAERELIQDRVDMVYEEFTASVTARRDVHCDSMQGQTFDGKEAQYRGLIDGQAQSAKAFFASLGKTRI